MGHTGLADRLRAACSAVGEALARGVPAEQVRQERSGGGLTRREFLRTASVAGAVAALPVSLRFPGRAAARSAGTAPGIVVVGAGLAGLTCAYRLMQAGYRAELYEASDRVGGRCWTRRGDFADGQITEHGGELIDSQHTAIRHLAQELSLPLDNLLRAEANGTEPLYYFDSQPYTYEEATRDIRQVWQKLHGDVSAAGYPTLYNGYTRRGWELDQMSITEWIDESVPGGMRSKLGRLLATAYTCEYGGEAGEQSALNLLYLLGYRGQGQLRMYGPSNEKYHVRGGNDQIPARMADALAGQIQTGAALEAIRRTSAGGYTLTFRSGERSWDVAADKVVLTLPFAAMRTAVDYSRAGFRPLKQTAIQELGMGTNTKLHLQFAERLWTVQGCLGETYADTGYQSTWDVSRAQTGAAGILVNFTGGTYGLGFSRGNPDIRSREFLAQLEPVMPGISARWNGKAIIDYWPGHRWTRGSYAYWKVGQYTRFAGIEGEREGDCHFAGEHTSIDFQGYLNGAVESGERAAAEILGDIKAERKSG